MEGGSDHVGINKRSICDLQAQCDNIQELIIHKKRQRIEAEYQDKMEALRVEEVLLHISVRGHFPKGMDGYNRKTKRFICWMSGYNDPVSKTIAEAHHISDKWFIDRALNVYLHWNSDGYYEMRREDSQRFIKENYVRSDFSPFEDFDAESSPVGRNSFDADMNSAVCGNAVRGHRSTPNANVKFAVNPASAAFSNRSFRRSADGFLPAGSSPHSAHQPWPNRSTAEEEVGEEEEEEEEVSSGGASARGGYNSYGEDEESSQHSSSDGNGSGGNGADGDDSDDSDSDFTCTGRDVHCAAPRKSGRQSKWTPQMDELLRDGVARFKDEQGWARVAEHVSDGSGGVCVAASQCTARWYSQQQKRKAATVTPASASAGFEDKQKLRPPSKGSISWTNKGRFSADEDALITQRVAEWGDKGPGLWVSLEKEMGRSGSIIGQRWKKTLIQRCEP